MRPQHELNGADITPMQEASFWSLVQIDWKSGCWEWRGMFDERLAYGRFKLGRRRHSANRVSYAIAYGHVPKDLVVRHTCDNSKCAAPHHLILGTDADNLADRHERNRFACGEESGCVSLTEAAVIDMRRREKPQAEYAAQYGVSKSTVGKVQTRVNWKHVP